VRTAPGIEGDGAPLSAECKSLARNNLHVQQKLFSSEASAVQKSQVSRMQYHPLKETGTH
jgi:hypothetical protein